jgi:hypothetical protein
VVVIATYYDPRDPSDHGVDPTGLTDIDMAIAPPLPS